MTTVVKIKNKRSSLYSEKEILRVQKQLSVYFATDELAALDVSFTEGVTEQFLLMCCDILMNVSEESWDEAATSLLESVKTTLSLEGASETLLNNFLIFACFKRALSASSLETKLALLSLLETYFPQERSFIFLVAVLIQNSETTL